MNNHSLSLALLCAALALTACKGGAQGGQAAAQDKQQEPAGLMQQDFATLQALYENADEDHGDEPLAKWAFVDVDGDGIDEIWMRDELDEGGALFTHSGGEFQLIGCESFRMKAYSLKPAEGKGYVCIAGPAGGPSYFTEVYTLQGSRVVERFNQLQVYDSIDEAWAGDKQLTEAEAKAYMEALPESRALTIDGWRWVDPTVLEADLERVPAHENSAEDGRVIEAFITDMFMSGRYTDEAFLEEHCTPRLLQQLRDDYDYEGEGYANWDFRSLANDGLAELDAIRRIDKKDGRYYYEGNDGGTLFRNILSAFVQDGKVRMDGIVRDRTYYAVPE